MFTVDKMDDLSLIVGAAKTAGAIGLKYFRKDPEVWIKGESSPVSEADLAIDVYLKEYLCSQRPDYGWLSEESEDDLARLSKKRVFIVDPIDGTRGFLEETENWVVSIAIVEDGRPLCGVLYGPVLKRLYIAEQGKGAFCNAKKISVGSYQSLEEGLFVVPARIAKSINDSLSERMQRARYVHSLAYRLALIAEGEFAGAIVRPSAKDWDLAAADLILEEAGGALLGRHGNVLNYNTKSAEHDWLSATGPKLQSPLNKVLTQALNQAMEQS